MAQTQVRPPDFAYDVPLIKKEVRGRIIRICHDGDRYHVWTDTGSKWWFMYYRFRFFINNDVEIQVMLVGCLDEDILIEPTDDPSALSPRYINDVNLIREVVEGKIIRICTHSTQTITPGSQYSVWTDTGSKRWFMYYRIEVSNNKAKILEERYDGCPENGILIEHRWYID